MFCDNTYCLALIYPWNWNPCTVEKKNRSTVMVDFFPLTSEVDGIQPVLNVDLPGLKLMGAHLWNWSGNPKETHQVPCQLKLLATTATLLTSVWRLKIVFSDKWKHILRFSFTYFCCDYNYYRVGLGIFWCLTLHLDIFNSLFLHVHFAT